MPLSRPVRAARRSRVVVAAVAAVLALAAVSGCGDTGGLQAAGPAPTASGPERLWPELAPATSPAYALEEGEREVVKGVVAPGGDLREVDPAALVRAEIAAHPDQYRGAKAPYRETAARMSECGAGEGRDRERCPLLTPYYRDLTGDGRADLTLGFRLPPGELTAVRVYTVEDRRIVRVMAWDDAFSSAELAERALVMRLPSDLPGYDYRLQWTWDPQQRSMLLTHDELVRDGPLPSPSSSPSPSPSSSPASSPSPSSSASSSVSPR
ncbi:hypothetical protein ACIQNG_31935 [Streptomyces sp. NPDC091377]|uniref:hypothetical protein n=1 Tax=Streptomyces sp. NPDC091377 TaxID=3365995 RepID=UPI0037F84A39